MFPQVPALPDRGIYRAGNASHSMWMKKQELRLRPIEETRLQNARSLAADSGGITAMALRLGKKQSQWQNTIGKTPKKRIGRDVTAQIEIEYGLLPGELDVHWPDGVAPSKRRGGFVEPASAAPDDDNIQALQWISGAIVNALAATQPNVAEAVVLALQHELIPDRFRQRGPIAAILSGLAGFQSPRGKSKGSKRNGPSKR